MRCCEGICRTFSVCETLSLDVERKFQLLRFLVPPLSLVSFLACWKKWTTSRLVFQQVIMVFWRGNVEIECWWSNLRTSAATVAPTRSHPPNLEGLFHGKADGLLRSTMRESLTVSSPSSFLQKLDFREGCSHDTASCWACCAVSAESIQADCGHTGELIDLSTSL